MPTQNSPPAPVPTATEKKLLVKNEIEEILKKEVTAPAQSELEQFLGSIPVIPIILPKKSSRFRPVIDMNLYVEDNQKTLNSHLEYNYFKMEDLLLLNELLQKRDYLCKLDLKDNYLSIPLHRDSQKFQKEHKVYQFFILASAPSVLTKFVKVLIAILR